MDGKKPVRFCFGTEAKYNTINKDPNAIYFITNSAGGGRLYVGEQSYNVDVVNNLELGPTSTTTAPTVSAVVGGLNNKVSRCAIITDSTSATLPNNITLNTDTEYRYVALTYTSTATPSLVLTIPNTTEYQFYSSIVLSKINFSGTIEEFVSLASASPVQTIRFLNGDMDLSGNDVVELLFFSNGIDICCIGATYSTSV